MKRSVKKIIASSYTPITLSSWIIPINAISTAEVPEPLVISITSEISNMDMVQTDASLEQGRTTVNIFYEGIAGVPGFGTIWGEFYPTQKRMTVYTHGKKRNTRIGNPGTAVRVTASRAFSGNTSGWWQAQEEVRLIQPSLSSK